MGQLNDSPHRVRTTSDLFTKLSRWCRDCAGVSPVGLGGCSWCGNSFGKGDHFLADDDDLVVLAELAGGMCGSAIKLAVRQGSRFEGYFIGMPVLRMTEAEEWARG